MVLTKKHGGVSIIMWQHDPKRSIKPPLSSDLLQKVPNIINQNELFFKYLEILTQKRPIIESQLPEHQCIRNNPAFKTFMF